MRVCEFEKRPPFRAAHGAGAAVGDLLGQIAGLRERISTLSVASLRIGSSLDLDTVLKFSWLQKPATTRKVIPAKAGIQGWRGAACIAAAHGVRLPEHVAYAWSG